MAIKKPICNYAGKLKELQSGDTLPGGGGAVAFKTVEKDFGNFTYYGEWTISDTDVSASSNIIAFLSMQTPTGRDADEPQMEAMDVCAQDMAAGSFALVAIPRSGPVEGKYKFTYLIG